MIRSMEGFTFSSALDLNMSYHHIKFDANAQKLCTIVFPWNEGKIQIQTLTHGYQDCLVPDVSQNVMSKLVQDMEYVKTYLDDLLIPTNRSFKDHLLKLEMVLARLSTAGMRVNVLISPNLSSLQNKFNTCDTGLPDKVFNLYLTRLRQSLILRLPNKNSTTTTPVYWYSQLLSRHVVSQK
jgi:hypothetical protein